MGETEISMTMSGAGAWTGDLPSFVLGTSGQFLYRVAIVSVLGAVWALQISDEVDRTVLSYDSDAVVRHKTWLVGSCVAACSAAPCVALSLVQADKKKSGAANAMLMRRRGA